MSRLRVGAAALTAMVLVLGASLASTTSAAQPVPPAATARPADFASCVSPVCGGWATFQGVVRGAVAAELRPDGKARLTVSFAWDLDNDGVRLVGSSRACSAAYTSASRILGYSWGLSQTSTFRSAIVTPSRNLAKLRSFRLFQPNGGPQVACGFSLNFSKIEFATASSGAPAAPPSAEGAYASFNKAHARGLVLLRLAKATGKARLTVALSGLPQPGTFTIFGSDAPCGTTHRPSDLEFSATFVTDANPSNIHSTRTISTQDPYGLRSVRIVEGTGTGGPGVACVQGFFVEINGTDVWIE